MTRLFACMFPKWRWCHRIGLPINHATVCVDCGRSFPARFDLPIEVATR